MQANHFYIGALIIGIFASSGCRSIGPGAVERDRFDYNEAIANSWKKQTLLNIVKLRYSDMPLFVEVASIVSGYTLQQAVNLSGSVASEGAVQGDIFGAGASAVYTDRPTITYSPLTGKSFAENFMTPIPPQSILFLIQTGWSADVILGMTVDSMNGLRSRTHAGRSARQGDSDFYRCLDFLRQLQLSGTIGMKIIGEEDDKLTTVIFIHKQGLEDEQKEVLREAWNLLGLDVDNNELEVRYGSVPEKGNELAIMSRSILQIMIEMATMIDVPEEHVEKGITVPSLDAEDGTDRRMLVVKCAEERPDNAFTAVKYHGHWFWIEDSDYASKRTFAFLMLLTTVTESGGDEGLPLVTIPTG